MLRVFGCPVTPEEARQLVAGLIADGGPNPIAAAEMIEKGVSRDLHSVGITPEMRDAILRVLEDDPPDGLVDLRAVLARDQRDRSREDTHE